MRVLHLIPYYKPAWKLGGPVRSVSLLCEGLADLGVQVEVLTTNAAGGRDRLDVEVGRSHCLDGVHVTYLHHQRPERYYFTPRLRSLIRQRLDEFDIIHRTGVFTFFNIAASYFPRRARVPFVVSPRGSFMPNAMRRHMVKHLKKAVYARLIERHVVGRAAAVHCTTDMELRALREFFPNASAFVVPNGIDVEGFERLPRPGMLRKRLGISEGSHVFLYVGRLHRHKGLDLSIRALSTLACKGLDLSLIVVGGPEVGSAEEWKDLAKRLNFAHRCHFVGQVDEDRKPLYLADADTLILNSYSENFGISVAEALVCGLPVLISDNVGLADWVSENRAGMVVPQDVACIAQAAQTMVTNRKMFQDAMIGARKAAQVEFGHRVCAGRMLEEYRSIIESGRPLGRVTASRPEDLFMSGPHDVVEGQAAL